MLGELNSGTIAPNSNIKICVCLCPGDNIDYADGYCDGVADMN